MKRNGSTRRSFKGGRVGSAYRARRAHQRRSRWQGSRTMNRRVGGFLGIETKFYDTKLISSVINAPSDASAGEQNPSATICLNSVTQGDGESQRDGRKITMKSIFIEGHVAVSAQASQSTADAASTIFIALVMDTQTNGALFNSEDVFTNPSASATCAGGPFRNLQFSKRFRVLATRKFVMYPMTMTNDTGATGGVIQGGLIKKFRFYKNLATQVIYNGTTETIANITDNSLSLIAYTNSTGLAPQLFYNARLRFVG